MTESTDALAPKAAFLGVCERIALVREGPPQLWRHNVIGLRQTVVNFFYPARLNGLHLLVACYEPQRLPHVALRLVAEDGAEIFKLELEIQTRPQSHNLQSVVEERAWRVLSPNGPTWLLFDRSLDIAVIPRPG